MLLQFATSKQDMHLPIANNKVDQYRGQEQGKLRFLEVNTRKERNESGLYLAKDIRNQSQTNNDLGAPRWRRHRNTNRTIAAAQKQRREKTKQQRSTRPPPAAATLDHQSNNDGNNPEAQEKTEKNKTTGCSSPASNPASSGAATPRTSLVISHGVSACRSSQNSIFPPVTLSTLLISFIRRTLFPLHFPLLSFSLLPFFRNHRHLLFLSLHLPWPRAVRVVVVRVIAVHVHNVEAAFHISVSNGASQFQATNSRRERMSGFREKQKMRGGEGERRETYERRRGSEMKR
ncbi:hypothetical protein BVRB_1g015110 [Beta vulgaris subsp. vulgaris]|nr:hypothetical protein BVRB_1g015110 [Beta vulgaris subsp. vulgaris]